MASLRFERFAVDALVNLRFLYGSRMALLTQEVAEQVFSPPSIPGVPDNPAMMCMYGQQFDMQATYLFVCADQTKTPTDESLLETIETRPGSWDVGLTHGRPELL